MSVITPPTFIHILDDDALLHIFTINANMFLDRYALHTTRAASLVCQRWRNLMLGTPSLWAKLIDVDLVSWAGHYEWRNELMRRSGTALLWIRVDMVKSIQPDDPSKAIARFFFNVICEENWHRIQKFVVNINVSREWHPTTWNPLNRPAPQLETFDMMFERTQPAENTDNTPMSTFFAESAPMLRRFRFSSHALDERVPWLLHLHFMELDGAYNIRHALSILSSTHRLQRLNIRNLNREPIPTPLPIADLPHLKYLEYNGRPQEGAILLDHIEIPLNCSLKFPDTWYGIPDAVTEERHLSIATTFSRYAQRYLRSHAPNVISLELHQMYCIIMKIEGAADVPLFDISIPLVQAGSTSAPSTVQNQVALQEFSCVTELKFHSASPINPSLGPFLSCFTSLNTICTDSNTLGYLTALQNDINSTNEQMVIFPLLEDITLDLIDNFNVSDIYKVDSITAGFILSRIREGHPIKTLRLREMSFEDTPDFEALAEAKGLKVLYPSWEYDDLEGSGTLEYICGGVDREGSSDSV